ncbi:MAG TPA: 3-deoxy-D-manno-octulosonic acid transferase, partial [Flavisolibacter sp.]|nr:3-deoxy-D-manno-octulosonic acid transferase [Flavisolibacter sp.]
KYREASELIKFGGGFSFTNAEELKNLYNGLSVNQQAYTTACDRSYQYILENTGATEKILNYVQANLLLTN